MSHTTIKSSGAGAAVLRKKARLPGPSLGTLLIDAGKITPEDRDRILHAQEVSGERFGHTAKVLGLLGDADIQEALARQFGFSYLKLEESGFHEALIIAHEPFGVRAEAIRTLRMQLQQTWFNTGHKVLAIVTPEVGVGSELLGNLAIAYAQLGVRTLVVDANLRSPRQHDLFDLGHRPGLAELLAGRVGKDVIARIPVFDSLRVLAAGAVPPNPQELLCGMIFGSVLSDFSEEYDVVLIDTPPFGDNVDACVIGSAAGAAVVTARRDVSRLRDIKAVNAALTMTGVPIIGVVLAEY